MDAALGLVADEVGAEPTSLDADRQYRGDESRHRTARAKVAVIAGVLVPLGLLAYVAGNTVLGFDGGLNLKVSDSIANGHGFAWDYGGHTVSPYLVQTSGLFTLLGALFIKLFGTSTLVLQLPSLVFLALLLGTISCALRPWRTVQVVGPLLFALGTPGILAYGLGGYGEFAVGFFMLAAFLLVTAAIEGADRPLQLCGLASALIGTSFSIKAITVAELPVLLGGFALLAVCRPEIPRKLLAATPLWAFAPVAAFEAYRGEQLGSVSAWAHYWSRQLHGMNREASAATDVRQGLVNAHKGWPRIDSLAEQIHVHAPLAVLVWLLLPVVALAHSYRRRRGSRTSWLTDSRRSLELLLAGLVVLYTLWFVFVSPLDWLRHFQVAVIAVSVLYLLLLGRIVDGWRERSRTRNRARRLAVSAPVFAALALVALVCTSVIATHTTRDIGTADRQTLTAERAASAYVANLARQGATLCGDGGMSAPVLSLTAHLSLCDLSTIDSCAPPARGRFDQGDVYLIWDRQAALHYPDGPPRSATYRYAEVARPSAYASIWRTTLRAGTCP